MNRDVVAAILALAESIEMASLSEGEPRHQWREEYAEDMRKMAERNVENRYRGWADWMAAEVSDDDE